MLPLIAKGVHFTDCNVMLYNNESPHSRLLGFFNNRVHGNVIVLHKLLYIFLILFMLLFVQGSR